MSRVYLLKTRVDRDASQADFDFSVSQLNRAVTLECLDLYARPSPLHRDRHPEAEILPKQPWHFSIEDELSPLGSSVYTIYSESNEDPLARTNSLLRAWFSQNVTELVEFYQFLIFRPILQYLPASSSFKVELPNGFALETNDPLLFRALGIDKPPDDRTGKYLTATRRSIANTSHSTFSGHWGHPIKHLSAVDGKPQLSSLAGFESGDEEGDLVDVPFPTERTNLSLQPPNTLNGFKSMIRFRPMRANSAKAGIDLAAVSEDGTPRDESLEGVRQAFRSMLPTLLGQVNLEETLLTVMKGNGELIIKARDDWQTPQSLTGTEGLPVKLKMSWNEAAERDLQFKEPDRSATFHFGSNVFSALRENHVDEIRFGPWRGDPKSPIDPSRRWTNPLEAITPFSLVVSGQESGDFVTDQGFVHVLAYATSSGSLQPGAPFSTAQKDDRLTVRFLDSSLNPHAFSQPFSLHIVLRVTPLEA